MSSRLTGEIRLRLSGVGARAHIQDARKLLGALKEQLSYNKLKTGQLIRTLPDGTVVRAIYDGTLYTAEIATPAPGGPCTSWIPDIVGLATAITDPEDHPPPDEPVPAYLPVTQHTAIVGWVVPRPAADGLLASLTGESAVARWPAAGFRPPEADGTPRGIYDRVVDACGNTHPAHENLVYGNWDWTNGRDTLTCWSGHAYNLLPSGTAYVAGQRYGVPGVSQDIYLRGRLLHAVDATRVVNGMALRQVDGVTYLMVVWRNILNNDGGLQRVRVRWPASEPYPSVDEAEDVCEFQQMTTVMWCFNASGTEARRIALTMGSVTAEQILTDDGVEELDPAELTEDSYSVGGTATARDVWLPFTPMFYGAPDDTAPYRIPLITAAGDAYDELYEAYFDYGRTVAATGSGELIEKLAVDYIGDTPEYLMIRTSGGTLTETDEPSSALNTITDVLEEESDNPGPHPCPSVVTNTYTYHYEWHKTIESTRTRALSYTTATRTWTCTTFGDIAASVTSGTATRATSSTLRRHDTQDITLVEEVTTDVGCFESGVLISGTDAQNDIYSLDESTETTETANADLASLLYADLRHGTFVVFRAQSNTSTSVSRTTEFRLEHGGIDAEIWRYYTDTVESTSNATASGTEALRVLHRSEEMYANSVTLDPESASLTTTSHPIGLDEDDSLLVNQARFYPAVWQYFAASFLTLIEGAGPPDDAYDYGGSPGAPDEVEWYDNSPNAVRADGEYGGSTGMYLEQLPDYSWSYPLFITATSVHRQPVVYQPDSYLVEPEDYTFAAKKPLYSVQFSVVADADELFLSMPLPTNGYSAEWVVVNVMPEWVYEKTAAPDTYRFYPMTLISPAFNA